MARPRSDIPQRILRAARDHFLRYGVDGASLRSIAQDAGTNIGMIYYYHKTKDELFFAVVEAVYAQVIDEMTEIVATDQAVEDRIRQLYLKLSELSDEQWTVVRIVIRELLVPSPRVDQLAKRFFQGHVPLIYRLMSDGLNQGHITDQHHPFAIGISAVLLGVFPQLIRRQIPENTVDFVVLPEAGTLAASTADILLDGIRKRS